MDHKEIQEAKAALDGSLQLIAETLASIQSAKNWGLWDILGGGMVSSLIKRRKIGDINEQLTQLERQLRVMVKELADVDQVVDFQIPDTFADNFFDIAFDNIFTDISTQRELNNAEYKLSELRDNLMQIQQVLVSYKI